MLEQLLESGVSVYPISPVSSKAYPERKAPSGTQSDRVDAWSLADALRLDGHNWKALATEDPLVAELRLLWLGRIPMPNVWRSSGVPASLSPGRCSPTPKAGWRSPAPGCCACSKTGSKLSRAEIEKLFAQHPDHDLFGSLPGAGPKIAPRMVGQIGSDRARFDDPSALQSLTETALVSFNPAR